MANELKPCPFCGAPEDEIMIFADPNEAIDNSGPSRRVQCAGCNIEAPFYPSEAEAIDAWNTRPAAPVEGLETVAWATDYGHRIGTVCTNKKDLPDFRLMWAGELTELVTLSQAEDIIAAERADKERWKDLYGNSVNANSDLHDKIATLKANNAALTARVKELEGEVFHDPELGITWKQICEQFDKECAHHQQRAEALETQLAAVMTDRERAVEWRDHDKDRAERYRNALEEIDNAVSTGRFIAIRKIVRATLEDRP